MNDIHTRIANLQDQIAMAKKDLQEAKASERLMREPVMEIRQKIANTYQRWNSDGLYDRANIERRYPMYGELDNANAELAPYREESRWRKAILTELEGELRRLNSRRKNGKREMSAKSRVAAKAERQGVLI